MPTYNNVTGSTTNKTIRTRTPAFRGALKKKAYITNRYIKPKKPIQLNVKLPKSFKDRRLMAYIPGKVIIYKNMPSFSSWW